VVMNNSVFWDITPCTFGESRHFEGALLAACFLLVTSLAYSSTLKIEATCSSEASVDFHRTTQCYNPEDTHLFICIIFKLLVQFYYIIHCSCTPLSHHATDVTFAVVCRAALVSTCCDADPFLRRLDHVLKIFEYFVFHFRLITQGKV
jgi:hypothetical protein